MPACRDGVNMLLLSLYTDARNRTPYDHWYWAASWRARRDAQLARSPLCELCQQCGLVVAATVANHRIPHKGDWSLFADDDNLQSVCRTCHDGAVRSYEATGKMRGCDANGMPLDPNDPWAKEWKRLYR